jgi:hypothetical protein
LGVTELDELAAELLTELVGGDADDAGFSDCEQAASNATLSAMEMTATPRPDTPITLAGQTHEAREANLPGFVS